MKKLYIIAGSNGAGKTTVSYTILPEMLDCNEFVNADEIAKGLSPFKPENGLKNFFNIFKPIVDEWVFIDNSGGPYEILAEGNSFSKDIQNNASWTSLIKKYKT